MGNALAPYNGVWSRWEAAHLLRRTLFGPTLGQIQDAKNNGLAQTVDTLLTTYLIQPPVNYDSDDSATPVGQTWINRPLPEIEKSKAAQARYRSTRAWLVERCVQHNQVSITEKLCLFWQNHFACDYPSSDPQGGYEYLMLMRDNCLGNFKQLVKDMTVNALMLRFLNGNESTKKKPNENYARELLELYTIGKGPQIASGDYTNYTEQDILAGAKILTGWRYKNHSVTQQPLIQSYFTENRHDNSDKKLSKHFGEVTITGNGAAEYADFIDVIFQQDQVAHFICRKLYQWFVDLYISSEVDTTVVADMAQTLIANDYEVIPVLRSLFLSEHFYDIAHRGAIIKNPIELMASMLKSTNSSLNKHNYTVEDNYTILYGMNYRLQIAGMNYFQPPNVAGWTAYYLEPTFSELWINSAYLAQRFSLSDILTLYSGFGSGNVSYKIDLLGFLDVLEQLSTPSDPETLISELEILFCCKPLEASQRDALKKTLTDGLPDFEWTAEYGDYIANPGNPKYSNPVKKRIKLVLSQLFKMPEFQLQ